MEQEQNDLLFKDICARLPYNVKCYEEAYCKVKPYLFPLSSMTEEQKEEFRNKFDINIDISEIFNGIDFCGSISFRTISEIINWCYKNHLDINDLIPKDLAIDATNLNIY